MIKVILIGTIVCIILLLGFISFIVYFMKSYYKLDFEKRRQENELKQLLAESSIKSEENERKRIGEDLHDEIAPILLRASRKLESQLEIANGYDKGNLKSAIEYIQTGMKRIRDISHVLHPSAIESFGLFYALHDFGANMENSMACEMEISTEIEKLDIDPFNQLMLFRIVQELILNAFKHGRANQFNITIYVEDEFLNIVVYHNGSEFLQTDYLKSLHNLNTLGLKYIEQRLKLLSCNIVFDTDKERGEQSISLLYPINNLLNDGSRKENTSRIGR